MPRKHENIAMKLKCPNAKFRRMANVSKDLAANQGFCRNVRRFPVARMVIGLRMPLGWQLTAKTCHAPECAFEAECRRRVADS